MAIRDHALVQRALFEHIENALATSAIGSSASACSRAPNLEPRDEIWPTDTASVIRAGEGGAALLQLPWGLAPGRPGGRAVINMRSEGRAFAHGRCLVPASHYYEFTGTKSPKTR